MRKLLRNLGLAIIIGTWLSMPGCSPIRILWNRYRVDALCDTVRVGERFNEVEFERAARSSGLDYWNARDRGFVVADAMYILLTRRQCVIDLSDGRVTRARPFTYAP